MKFIGIDTRYLTASGDQRRRVHLDGAASPLAASISLEVVQSLLPHYSSSHSQSHQEANMMSEALAWARTTILTCLQADPEQYTIVFSGSGCTTAINRLARGMALQRADKPIVLVSAMEHHANDLPHRQPGAEVIHIPLEGGDEYPGTIDLVRLKHLLDQHAGRVRYVAVTVISNVTGIQNPIDKISRLAAKFKVPLLVDAAQFVAHRQWNSCSLPDVDFMVFSGHKVYSPMAPGVLLAKRQALAPLDGQDVGGGAVSDVSYVDHLMADDLPRREQAGTPNVLGAVALARVMQAMHKHGYDKIERHERQLMRRLLSGLEEFGNIVIYGDPRLERCGAISFNHRYIDHGLLAAILSDYYAIAVRNECFCAHPYVSSMLKPSLWELDLDSIAVDQQQAFINRKRGMVRVSISMYTRSEDIEHLVSAIREIEQKIEELEKQYKPHNDGSYHHRSYKLNWQEQIER